MVPASAIQDLDATRMRHRGRSSSAAEVRLLARRGTRDGSHAWRAPRPR
jgi:hypothetical protein